MKLIFLSSLKTMFPLQAKKRAEEEAKARFEAQRRKEEEEKEKREAQKRKEAEERARLAAEKRKKEEEPQAKIFKEGPSPATHTPKAVTSWINGLKLNKAQKDQISNDAEKITKTLGNPEDMQEIQSKLLAMGLSIKVVSAMKKSELCRTLAAGLILAANKA